MAAAAICFHQSYLDKLARPLAKQQQRVLELLDELRLAGSEHSSALVRGGSHRSARRRERRRAFRDAEPAAAAAVARFIASFSTKGLFLLLASCGGG